MSTIVIRMLEETGHINPSFKLARALQARGHRVVYLEPPDHEEAIVRQGFEFVPMFGEIYPLGTAAAVAAMTPFGRLRALKIGQEREIEQFENGTITRLLESVAPDLVLADYNRTEVAVAAYGASIPAGILLTTFPSEREPGIAPLDTPVVGSGSLGRARAWLAWQRLLARRRVLCSLSGSFKRLGFTLHERPEAIDWVADYAERSGYPRRAIEKQMTFPIPDLLDMPQLVLSPPALDFPRKGRDGRYFVGSIDLDRRDVADTAWSRGLDDRPLVFCSLGTQSHRYGKKQRLLRSVLDAASKLPRFQFLVAHRSGDDLGPIPPNASIVGYAPQLEVLKRATLMITHGGLGSVKECAFFGVPMIVVPHAFDQFGNAARVEFHGAGAVVKPRNLHPSRLASLVGEVHDSPRIRSRVQELKREMHAIELAGDEALLIERLLHEARHGRSARSSGAAADELSSVGRS